MATFSAAGRLTFTLEIQIGEYYKVVKVCDDGWKIWFKDPAQDDAFLYAISLGTDSMRTPDRETALNLIRSKCGWWNTQWDIFTDPKMPKREWIPVTPPKPAVVHPIVECSE